MSSKLKLLDSKDCMLCLIDHEPQMVFGIGSHERQMIVNNVTGLARAAKLFQVPTVITSIAAKDFSGPIFQEITHVFPETKPIDRTNINAWEDKAFKAAVEKTGKKRLVMAGLWTELCLLLPVLSAMNDGYEVYFVTDASGGTSSEVHEMAIQRMIQAGAVPMTWLQVALEWQRDWSKKDTYDGVMEILKDHAGAYGQGVAYVESMLPKK